MRGPRNSYHADMGHGLGAAAARRRTATPRRSSSAGWPTGRCRRGIGAGSAGFAQGIGTTQQPSHAPGRHNRHPLGDVGAGTEARWSDILNRIRHKYAKLTKSTPGTSTGATPINHQTQQGNLFLSRTPIPNLSARNDGSRAAAACNFSLLTARFLIYPPGPVGSKMWV